MKIWMFVILFCTSFKGLCEVDEIELKKASVAFAKLSDCLKLIPDVEIKNPDYKVVKNLSLLTSVIENVALELGAKPNTERDFQALYKVAFKHCEAQIKNVKQLTKTNG